MSETRSAPLQLAARCCPSCADLFTPSRPQQAFCSSRCRAEFHRETGASGKVASVRRISKGASVVVHLTGPAAEAALQLKLGEIVRLVSAP